MPESLDELVSLMDLEELEVGLYRGRQPATGMQRAFGGQVLSQALVACGRTVEPDRIPHSVHAYFLLPGSTDAPILYDVQNIRDGGSFSFRRVEARQHGKVIFYLTTSCHGVEQGFEHADPAPDGVPAPDDCPRLADLMAELSGRPAERWEREWGALDVRYVGDSRPGGRLVDPRHPARAQVWVRTAGTLPDDPALHRAVLAYASDLTLLGVSTVPHGVVIGSKRLQAASIDHAMWFHRPIRVDDWILYDQVSPSAAGGRGMSSGRLFADGVLGASVAQEGLIRPVEPR
ncbi:acyl-CoA thioesterase [Propionibacteriaceae bacterium Y2011]|uniref:acyl-CoA thioesterase n=1 Tax=Microlunatus sp. Y2014 TaxID=3418488 RepID=UPI003B4DB1CD